jgi:hypothetical protein
VRGGCSIHLRALRTTGAKGCGLNTLLILSKPSRNTKSLAQVAKPVSQPCLLFLHHYRRHSSQSAG